MLDQFYTGDALSVLKTFPDNSIDMCLTSPPYFQLRSYLLDDHPDKDKEVGYGCTIDEYVQNLTNIFSEVYRVLSPTGSFYLNIGDGYCSSGKQTSQKNLIKHADKVAPRKNPRQHNSETDDLIPRPDKHVPDGLKVKDLMMVPARVALSLQQFGWYIRSDIIFAKRNCTPSSVKDRPASSYEHVFLLTKSKSYYYDWEAIATEPVASTKNDKRPKGVLRQRVNENSKYHEDCDPLIEKQFRKQDNVGRSDYTGFNDRYTAVDKVRRRDVWSLTVTGSKIKHYAMMQPKLAELCILAGCPENGTVLDPFAGIGTTGLVAQSLGRNFVGIELNADYVNIAKDYLRDYRYDPVNKRVVKL